MRLIPSLLIFLCLSFVAVSQNLPKDFNNLPVENDDTSSVYLSIDNANFFKNNEYYNDYVAGYTKTGFFITPRVTYLLSPKTRLSGGMHLLKYSGENFFNQVRPVFYLAHQLTEGIDLIMGSIESTYHHNLVDPLYHYERYLDQNIENGMQFLIDKPAVEADVWINWKQFITKGSGFQEEFETGISSEFQLSGKDRNFTVNLPLQILIQHKGGQIDNTDKPVSTLSNFAAGTSMELDLNSRYLTSLALENLYVGYRDLSPGDNRTIQSGDGFMSSFFLNMNDLQLQFSWWKASKFMSFAGNPIYQAYSIKKERLISEERELFIGKLRYTRKYRDLHFMINFDSYWDPAHQNFDYGFGIYLLLNTDIFLTKISK